MGSLSRHLQGHPDAGTNRLHDGLDVLARKPAQADDRRRAHLLHSLQRKRGSGIRLYPARRRRPLPPAKDLRAPAIPETPFGKTPVRASRPRHQGTAPRTVPHGTERKPREPGIRLLPAHGHGKSARRRHTHRKRLLHIMGLSI